MPFPYRKIMDSEEDTAMLPQLIVGTRHCCVPTSFPTRIYRFKMGLEGFEPPTSWFVAMHSIQLSYKPLLLAELKF